MFMCAETLIIKKEHIKSIRKEFGSLEDYGWISTKRSTRSQHSSGQESNGRWGLTSTNSVKDFNTKAG